jgi:hypothetical protein
VIGVNPAPKSHRQKTIFTIATDPWLGNQDALWRVSLPVIVASPGNECSVFPQGHVVVKACGNGRYLVQPFRHVSLLRIVAAPGNECSVFPQGKVVITAGRDVRNFHKIRMIDRLQRSRHVSLPIGIIPPRDDRTVLTQGQAVECSSLNGDDSYKIPVIG